MSIPGHQADAPRERRYVDWYMWARAQGMNQQACHGAARAAVKAEGAFADPSAAAFAGGKRANRDDQDPPATRRELCNWYVWAVEDRKLPPERALEVAKAAATSVRRGMSRSQAMDVGLAYERGERVRLGPPFVTRILRDPGFGLLVVAIAILAIALFTDFGAYALLLALFSVIGSARSMRRGSGNPALAGLRFTPMVGAGFLVDLAALMVVVLGWRL